MLCSYSVMKELIAYETWNGVMWPKWRRSRQGLTWWTGCNGEGQVKAVKLGQDLAPMDRGNGEERAMSRSMNQRGHVIIWSGSYHSRKIKPSVESWWWSTSLMEIGACVATTYEKRKRNVQGKDMTCRAFHFTGHRCVEKCMTEFKIDGRTIKRGKLVCISVI